MADTLVASSIHAMIVLGKSKTHPHNLVQVVKKKSLRSFSLSTNLKQCYDKKAVQSRVSPLLSIILRKLGNLKDFQVFINCFIKYYYANECEYLVQNIKLYDKLYFGNNLSSFLNYCYQNNKKKG